MLIIPGWEHQIINYYKNLCMNTTQKNVLSRFKGTEITRNSALVKPKVGNGTRVNMTYFALGCILPLNFHRRQCKPSHTLFKNCTYKIFQTCLNLNSYSSPSIWLNKIHLHPNSVCRNFGWKMATANSYQINWPIFLVGGQLLKSTPNSSG